MPANRLSIFLAEDDELIRELVRTRLELAGYHTRWASNGPEAMAQCNLVKPDALILDINLPGLDGLSILARWKERGVTPPPTLMLTARHNAADVKEAIALGAKDYLTQPVNDAVLLSRVARLVRSVTPRVAPLPSPEHDDIFL
jgi:two-component system OmpR family response regulator